MLPDVKGTHEVGNCCGCQSSQFFVVSVPRWSGILSHWPILEEGAQITDRKAVLSFSEVYGHAFSGTSQPNTIELTSE